MGFFCLVTAFKIFISGVISSDIWSGCSVLWQCISEAIKHDFRLLIRQYTSPNENIEYGYLRSNALLDYKTLCVFSNWSIVSKTISDSMSQTNCHKTNVIQSDIALQCCFNKLIFQFRCCFSTSFIKVFVKNNSSYYWPNLE